MSREEEKRPSWADTWFEMCFALARRSTCWKHQTAAILVDQNNRQVSAGYNGVPAGESHCCDSFLRDPIEHREWSREHEIHAEMNVLLYLSRYPRAYDPATSTLYTLMSPCADCAKAIHAAGIGSVVVWKVHKQQGLNYLAARGVRVHVVSGQK